MLRIVASYHCMQFQVKLMNQTWENDNKPSFRPNCGPFGTNLGPKIFFKDLTLMLDTAASYHCMQLEKMAKKNLAFGLILAHLALIPAANFFPQKSGSASH